MTQIGTATTTKRPQLSSDQNHTLVETAKIIEGGGNNMSIILKLSKSESINHILC
ncbi:MAG TPA: hypothetical protein VIP29_05720 [Nitrososphaeraceae archaeon]|nr:hypothetical protein [Nitrososphaeraceae archaeon]